MARLLLLSICLLFAIPVAFSQFNKLTRLVKEGEFEKALHHADKKIAKLDQRKLRQIRLQGYHLTLAKIHYTLGNYKEADQELKKSMEFVNARLARRKRLRLSDFDVMDETAMFYVNTGNFNQAREYINRSLKLRVRKFNPNNPTNFRPYLPLGMLFFYQNQFDSARHYLSTYQKQIRNSNYTGFLDINRYADGYQILAEIEMKAANWEKARRYARKSARLQQHPWTIKQIGKNYLGRVRALNTLSTAFRATGKIKKADTYNKRALDLYKRKYRNENYVLVPVYLTKARLSIDNNNIDTAKLYLKKTIFLQRKFIENNFNHLSEYEKENYHTRLRDGFHEINAMMLKLFQDGKVTVDDPFWLEILNYIINTKALILNETNRVIENVRTSKDAELRELFKRWRMLKNQWAYLSGNAKKKNVGELTVLQDSIVSVEKRMALKAFSLSGNAKETDWTQVKLKLARSEAAIEVARVDISSMNADSSAVYLAFIIRSDDVRPEIVILPNGKQLEERYIRNYFNSINHHIEDTVSFRAFWKPLAVALRDVKRVYISADGVFHLINTEIIKDRNTKRYLTEDLSIVNITNIGNLVKRKNQKFTFTTAGLFGSPDFSGYSDLEESAIGFAGTISPLPGTQAEVKEISSLLRNNSVNVQSYVDKTATEQQLSGLQSFDVLHLATHGFFTRASYGTDAMLASGLVLAKDPLQEKDGILTAYEASTLNLDATRLVVLSACKTGLGAIREGEGVYGLQRAFEVAGVDYIIMTLWNVDDAVTKEFMVDFYAKLLQEKDVHAAFRKAQLRLKERYPDIYYWGAFKLISS